MKKFKVIARLKLEIPIYPKNYCNFLSTRFTVETSNTFIRPLSIKNIHIFSMGALNKSLCLLFVIYSQRMLLTPP